MLTRKGRRKRLRGDAEEISGFIQDTPFPTWADGTPRRPLDRAITAQQTLYSIAEWGRKIPPFVYVPYDLKRRQTIVNWRLKVYYEVRAEDIGVVRPFDDPITAPVDATSSIPVGRSATPMEVMYHRKMLAEEVTPYGYQEERAAPAEIGETASVLTPLTLIMCCQQVCVKHCLAWEWVESEKERSGENSMTKRVMRIYDWTATPLNATDAQGTLVHDFPLEMIYPLISKRLCARNLEVLERNLKTGHYPGCTSHRTLHNIYYAGDRQAPASTRLNLHRRTPPLKIAMRLALLLTSLSTFPCPDCAYLVLSEYTPDKDSKKPWK